MTEMPELPWNTAEGPVFKAPWEAAAFAMTVRLHEGKHFTWNEWADHLAAEITGARERGEPDLGDTYYEHWLRALEKIVIGKGIASHEELGQLKEDWIASTLATPHGQPIELKRSAKAKARN